MTFRLLYVVATSAPMLLAVAAFGWGGNTVAGRLAVGEISPMVVVFMRWTIVFAILLLFCGANLKSALKILRGNWVWAFAMGAFGICLFNALFYIAANSTTAINLGLIQCSMPMFILIGVRLIYKAKLTIRQVFGTFLAISGVSILVSRGDLDVLIGLQINTGDWIMLIACLLYAGYSIGLKNRPKIDYMTMMMIFSGAAWLFSIPLVLFEVCLGIDQWPNSQLAWFVIFFVSLVPSLLSQVFYMRGVDMLGPDKAGVYSNLVPIFSAVLGILILNEALNWYHLLSLFIVISGLTIISKSNQNSFQI